MTRWSPGRWVGACVLCLSKVFFFFLFVWMFFLISLHMFFKCLKSCYICESYHHARQAANHRRHNQPHRNHLYLPAVKRLSIIVFDMQNRAQSQTFRAIISGQNIDVFPPPPGHFLAQLHIKHIQISHSGKSVGSLMIGSLGSLRVDCGLV